MKKTLWPVLSILVILTGIGGIIALRGGPDGELILGDRPDLPTLTFYTTGLATTPQFPFWCAVRNGRILEHCNLRVRMWKGLDDLRGLLLAGKGDLWLGHTEGFSQARCAGAPVQLLAVSGWKKFYILSTDPACGGLSDFMGKTLPFAPAGSPAVPILKAVATASEEGINFKPFEPKQLAMSLMRGNIRSALAPEPLVTRLLSKVKGLRIVAGVEDIYGRRTGRPARLPIAGMAVNRHTAERLPGTVRIIVTEMLAAAERLEKNPEEGIHALPEAFEAFVTRETIRKSLARDLVLMKPAAHIVPEIRAYLDILTPESAGTSSTGGASPENFIWTWQ